MSNSSLYSLSTAAMSVPSCRVSRIASIARLWLAVEYVFLNAWYALTASLTPAVDPSLRASAIARCRSRASGDGCTPISFAACEWTGAFQ